MSFVQRRGVLTTGKNDKNELSAENDNTKTSVASSKKSFNFCAKHKTKNHEVWSKCSSRSLDHEGKKKKKKERRKRTKRAS